MIRPEAIPSAPPAAMLSPDDWPPARPVPSALLPVPVFEIDRFMPAALAPWVADVSERAQCPPDFVAIGVVVAAASVIGRQVTIRPKVYDDWTVVPNLWGLAVAGPGLMKTSAMQEALRGVHHLVRDARERYQRACEAYVFDEAAAKAQRAALDKQLKAAALRGESVERLREAFAALPQPDPPTEQRYMVNDATVEKLGALLNENPNGLLHFRDEAGGWFQTMEREGHENDRAFFCEAWNGTGSYTYDRIGRGTLHIEAACVSILGGIQPRPLAAYLRETFGRGQDDGLIQRFQLLVYPDIPAAWRKVDHWPDSDARQRLVAAFQALDRLDLLAFGVHTEPHALPFLHFAAEGQGRFERWRAGLEVLLRTSQDHPVMLAHLAKYRSLVPSLALVFHLVDCATSGHGGPVSDMAVTRALTWVTYLETHARRVYRDVIDPGPTSVAVLAEKIRSGAVSSPLRARDIRLKGWTSLNTPDEVALALLTLEQLGWVRRVDRPASVKGGRPTVEYLVNPAVGVGMS